MKKRITAFLPFSGNDNTLSFAGELSASQMVGEIFLISDKEVKTKYKTIETSAFQSSKTIREIAKCTNTDFALLQLNDCLIQPARFFLERFITAAGNTSAGILYSDFYELKDEKLLAQIGRAHV